jgi:hypothetical protein
MGCVPGTSNATGGNTTGNIGYGEGGGDITDQGGYHSVENRVRQEQTPNQPVESAPVKTSKSPEARTPEQSGGGSTSSPYLEQHFYDKSPESNPSPVPYDITNTKQGGS